MVRNATVGLIVPMELTPEHASDFESYGVSALPNVQKEAETVHWFAMKQDNSTVYAFVTTFTGEEGRNAHLGAAMKRSDGLQTKKDWFKIPPKGMKVDVIAAKGAVPVSGPKAGVTVGLHVSIKAKEDKIEAVKEFLKGSLSLVDAEPATTHWMAIHHPGTNHFEIVDSFPDDAGRQAHLSGKVAEAVFANVDTLLEEPPKVNQLTVLEANVNA